MKGGDVPCWLARSKNFLLPRQSQLICGVILPLTSLGIGYCLIQTGVTTAFNWIRPGPNDWQVPLDSFLPRPWGLLSETSGVTDSETRLVEGTICTLLLQTRTEHEWGNFYLVFLLNPGPKWIWAPILVKRSLPNRSYRHPEITINEWLICVTPKSTLL